MQLVTAVSQSLEFQLVYLNNKNIGGTSWTGIAQSI